MYAVISVSVNLHHRIYLSVDTELQTRSYGTTNLQLLTCKLVPAYVQTCSYGDATSLF